MSEAKRDRGFGRYTSGAGPSGPARRARSGKHE